MRLGYAIIFADMDELEKMGNAPAHFQVYRDTVPATPSNADLERIGDFFTRELLAALNAAPGRFRAARSAADARTKPRDPRDPGPGAGEPVSAEALGAPIEETAPIDEATFERIHAEADAAEKKA